MIWVLFTLAGLGVGLVTGNGPLAGFALFGFLLALAQVDIDHSEETNQAIDALAVHRVGYDRRRECA